MTGLPRIFVDVSETLVMRGSTGIQRVVRRVVDAGAEPAAAAGFDWMPVVATAGGLRRPNAKGMALLREPTRTIISATGENASRRPRRVAALASAVAPRTYERLRLRKLDRAFAGLLTPDRVTVGPNDVYLVLDSFWVRSAAPYVAERLGRAGRRVAAVVYDVLPLTDPAFFVPDFADLVRGPLLRMARSGARFVAISAASARSAEQALPGIGQGDIRHFPLGFDLPERTVSEASGPTDVAAFLLVGTIEARKNHAVVLDAFERRWAAGRADTLTVIGKPGWGVASLLQRLATHPELGRRLFVEHAASDARLFAAYRSATATIVPSFAEGFGLPLIESLSYGVPVIASDIAVFRETLGGDPLMFDPHDPASLSRSIDLLLADPDRHRRRARAFSWVDWRRSASRLIDAVVR